MNTPNTFSLAGRLCLLLSAFCFPLSIFAQTTAFTYQGRLNDGVAPASGLYDLRFALFDADSGGAQQGNTRTNEATIVSNGLFTVMLSFGDVPFNGDDRWLEIGVRTNGGGAFVTLSPRQRITSVPYAIQAANAASAEYLSGTIAAAQLTGTIAPTNIGAGTISTAMLADGAVTSDKIGGVLLAAQIPDLDAAKITSGTLADARLSAIVARTNQVWLVGGNVGTTPGTHFIGTTDNQPLELRVNNMVGLRLEYPTVGTVPSLLGGFGSNSIGTGTEGAVIAGGGKSGGNENSIGMDADHSAIGGGFDNNIASNTFNATIAGGRNNSIAVGSDSSAIGGGRNNSIGVESAISVIGGGQNNGIASNSIYATIAGGLNNNIGVDSDFSAIGGGFDNNIASNALYAVIPGGYLSAVGAGATNAFAAGRRAKANHPGTFVWADSKDADFASTGTNQFNVRANGGVRLETGGAGATLDGQPLVTATSAVGDVQLSTNVALLNRTSQTFTGTNSFTQRVGIGTSASTSTLRVQGAGSLGDLWLSPTTSGGNADIFLSETTTGSFGIILRHNGASNTLDFVGVNSSVETTNPVVSIGRGNTSGMHVRNDLTIGGSAGIGETAPEAPLHVKEGSAGTVTASSSAIAVFERSADGYVTVLTPTNSQSGVLFGNPNNSADGGVLFNSTSPRGLEFRTGGNSTKMVIEAGGEVGIGTVTPSHRLTIAGTGNYQSATAAAIMLDNLTPGTGHRWEWHALDDGRMQFVDYDALAMRLLIDTNGNVGIGTPTPTAKLSVSGAANNTTGTWGIFSDRRLKDHIGRMEQGSLDRLLKLEGVTYQYTRPEFREGYDGIHRGWIAQQVEEVFPEWVSEAPDGMKMVTPVGFNALTVEALRELRTEKDEQFARLQAENAELKVRLEKLEQLLHEKLNRGAR